MPTHVEIYAAGGIAIGSVARDGHLRDALEHGGSLSLEDVTWHALDQSPPTAAGTLGLPVDDIHIAAGEQAEDLPVHAQWHAIDLLVGPYHLRGQMPTMPGFDPNRALARPTGQFVQLRDVEIGLATETDEAGLVRPMALVNRYVVDRVAADLMLGFFFPGAEMISTKIDPPVTAAGASMPAPAAADEAAMATEPVEASGAPGAAPEANPGA